MVGQEGRSRLRRSVFLLVACHAVCSAAVCPCPAGPQALMGSRRLHFPGGTALAGAARAVGFRNRRRATTLLSAGPASCLPRGSGVEGTDRLGRLRNQPVLTACGGEVGRQRPVSGHAGVQPVWIDGIALRRQRSPSPSRHPQEGVLETRVGSDEARHHIGQLLQVKRLAQKAAGTNINCQIHTLARRGDHHHGRMSPRPLPIRFCKGPSTHRPHAPIQQDQVWHSAIGQQTQGFVATAHADDLVAIVAQRLRDQLSDRFVIVDDEDTSLSGQQAPRWCGWCPSEGSSDGVPT